MREEEYVGDIVFAGAGWDAVSHVGLVPINSLLLVLYVVKIVPSLLAMMGYRVIIVKFLPYSLSSDLAFKAEN